MRVLIGYSTCQVTRKAFESTGCEAYRTPKNQDREIQDFEDQWYLLCVKSYSY